MALKTPLRWLSDFVELTVSPEELAETLTIAGLEVDGTDRIGAFWNDETVRIAQIIEVTSHPDADSLCLAKLKYGPTEELTVVTGAPNIFAMKDQLPQPAPKVPLALVGAEVIDAYGAERKLKQLKPTKIRGVESLGMACSALELGLSEEHEGVLILPEDAPVGRPLREYLGDTVLHFDIKGGFSHLLCILGIARETSAIYGSALRKDLLSLPSQTQEIVEQAPFLRLQIADPDLCARYTAFRIRDVEVKPSPFWMQQRLLQCGMRPINNIVDITNYVMLELGQPLHAFDYEALCKRSQQEQPLICVRRAKAGEKLTTLDEVERDLDPQMLLITDEGGPIAIAGVMGGGDTEVSDQTKDILLEAANFEFLNNRRTAQILKLRTEAAERFGKRIDPELTLLAGWRAATLIAELSGGTVEPVIGDLYPRRPAQRVIELDPNDIRRLLGIEIPQDEILRILRALEFEVAFDGKYQVTVPTHRMDVNIPADLVEELIRIYGYQNLTPSAIDDVMPKQEANPRFEGTEHIRHLMVSLGLNEVITYSLTNPSEEGKLRLEQNPNLSGYLGLLNPLSQERSHLRQTLVTHLLHTAHSNLRFLKRVHIFEISRIFIPNPTEELPDERLRLAVLMTGPVVDASWHPERKEVETVDFFNIKGVVEALLERLHVVGLVQWERATDLPYHPGRSANVLVDGQSIGYVGELHPAVAMEFQLPDQRFCIAELDMEVLLKLWNPHFRIADLSAFTPIYEDLAFVVPQGVKAGELQEAILRVGQPLLRSVQLFDVYQGDQVEAGSVSLAYALTFQAMDRTLKDKDVAKIRQNIVREMEQAFGARLR